MKTKIKRETFVNRGRTGEKKREWEEDIKKRESEVEMGVSIHWFHWSSLSLWCCTPFTLAHFLWVCQHPPFSSLLLFLTHTHTLGMPGSVGALITVSQRLWSAEGLTGLAQAKSNTETFSGHCHNMNPHFSDRSDIGRLSSASGLHPHRGEEENKGYDGS